MFQIVWLWMRSCNLVLQGDNNQTKMLYSECELAQRPGVVNLRSSQLAIFHFICFVIDRGMIKGVLPAHKVTGFATAQCCGEK